MPAYVIADIDVKDPAGYEEYQKLSSAAGIKHGGKYLVRGGRWEKLEGDWEPKRLVILEFGSVEQAKRWYDSEEYKKARQARAKTASANIVVVEGA